MTELENFLRNNAYYGQQDENLRPVDLVDFFDEYQLQEFSMGMHTRVFTLDNKQWVVKIGRWDVDVNLIGDYRIAFPAQALEELLSFFELKFLPRPAEITRQYSLYLTFCKYFGVFNQNNYYHPNLNDIIAQQAELRSTLSDKLSEVEKYYSIDLGPKIKPILNSNQAVANFLPKEYLVYGKSISPESEGKDTYYIFQEFVKGELLHDIDVSQAHLREKLIVMIYLMLLMRMQEGLVPDTRPRYVTYEMYDWISKTDNVIVTGKDLKFIDTRWLWDVNANIMKRGMLIPEVTINQAKRFLTYQLKQL